MNVDYKVDLLVLGMGAAAELAAIYAHDANPDLNILIATKMCIRDSFWPLHGE